jgi:hypothetical protein
MPDSSVQWLGSVGLRRVVASMKLDRSLQDRGGLPVGPVTVANYGRLKPSSRYTQVEDGHTVRARAERCLGSRGRDSCRQLPAGAASTTQNRREIMGRV